jgi:hypothetical protein
MSEIIRSGNSNNSSASYAIKILKEALPTVNFGDTDKMHIPLYGFSDKEVFNVWEELKTFFGETLGNYSGLGRVTSSNIIGGKTQSGVGINIPDLLLKELNEQQANGLLEVIAKPCQRSQKIIQTQEFLQKSFKQHVSIKRTDFDKKEDGNLYYETIYEINAGASYHRKSNGARSWVDRAVEIVAGMTDPIVSIADKLNKALGENLFEGKVMGTTLRLYISEENAGKFMFNPNRDKAPEVLKDIENNREEYKDNPIGRTLNAIDDRENREKFGKFAEMGKHTAKLIQEKKDNSNKIDGRK